MTPLYTLEGLNELVNRAEPRGPAQTRYVDGLDARVLKWLIEDSHRLRLLDPAVADMLAALHEWKCGACGGAGIYHQNARGTADAIERGRPLDPKFNPEPVPCKVCGGRGLHPRATAAIAVAKAAGLAPKDDGQ